MGGRFLSKASVMVFLLSAAVYWLPSWLVLKTALRHWFSNHDAVIEMIWWPALLLLAIGAMTKGKVGKWNSFISVVAGFSLSSIVETSLYLRKFPMPPELYLRAYVSSIIFPSTAAGLGIVIGSWLKRGFRRVVD
jgi:hypothetical protein